MTETVASMQATEGIVFNMVDAFPCMFYATCKSHGTLYCASCNSVICLRCRSTHDSSPFTRRHGPLTELLDWKLLLKYCTIYCHDKKAPDSLCRTCRVIACPECIGSFHKDHHSALAPLEIIIEMQHQPITDILARHDALIQRKEALIHRFKENERQLLALEETARQLRAAQLEVWDQKANTEHELAKLADLISTSVLSLPAFPCPTSLKTHVKDPLAAIPPSLRAGLVVHSPAPQLAHVAHFGGFGSAVGKLNYPWGLAVDAGGDILVTDSFNHRVQVFTVQGKHVRTFSGYGQGAGQLNHPRGIAVDRKGNIYVANSSNHRIEKFDAEGKFLLQIGSKGDKDGMLSHPYGVTIDSYGHVIVCDYGNNRIVVFREDGSFLFKFGSDGHGSGQFSLPIGLCVDSSDNIFLADRSNHRIEIFTSRGLFLRSFGTEGTLPGQLACPFGIAVDSVGNTVVAESQNHRVSIFRRDGQFLCSFGSPGTGVAQFLSPTNVIVHPSGQIIVSDCHNHRIQIFTENCK